MLNETTKKALSRPRVYSDLHANILDGFHAEGVEIMSPIYGALRDGNETAIAPVNSNENP